MTRSDIVEWHVLLWMSLLWRRWYADERSAAEWVDLGGEAG